MFLIQYFPVSFVTKDNSEAKIKKSCFKNIYICFCKTNLLQDFIKKKMMSYACNCLHAFYM